MQSTGRFFQLGIGSKRPKEGLITRERQAGSKEVRRTHRKSYERPKRPQAWNHIFTSKLGYSVFPHVQNAQDRGECRTTIRKGVLGLDISAIPWYLHARCSRTPGKGLARLARLEGPGGMLCRNKDLKVEIVGGVIYQ